MRILILSLILVCSFASAQTLVGAELQGSATLSGILQKLVIKDKLPIGSLSTSYGYGVLDFKNSDSYTSAKNKALYCVGVNYHGSKVVKGEADRFWLWRRCQCRNDI